MGVWLSSWPFTHILFLSLEGMRCIIARPAGSGAGYQQAKLTCAKSLTVEGMVTDNVILAVEKMASILQDTGAPVAIQLSAAKYFIEAHAKYVKAHGPNPVPANFVVDKEVQVTESEEDNVISLEFKDG